jgi:hypothetical protein
MRLKNLPYSLFGNTRDCRKPRQYLAKKSNAGDITIPNFKLYYRTIAIQTAWNWNKNRYEDLLEQIRGPRYESTQLFPPYFLQRHQKHTMENI